MLLIINKLLNLSNVGVELSKLTITSAIIKADPHMLQKVITIIYYVRMKSKKNKETASSKLH